MWASYVASRLAEVVSKLKRLVTIRWRELTELVPGQRITSEMKAITFGVQLDAVAAEDEADGRVVDGIKVQWMAVFGESRNRSLMSGSWLIP